MRALLQRVSEASVEVDSEITGRIGRGILVFLGIHQHDTEVNADYLASKITQLRIFPDDIGKMNFSVRDIGGNLLVVPQFTLYGETKKGNRPSYSQAARPEVAVRLYNYFVETCRIKGISVATGLFKAHMKVTLTNEGPVTLLCDSETQSGLS
jgi:D-aminoacyl-tRNA deacylase